MGFTPQAETWNGRLAMIGFIAALLTESLSYYTRGNSLSLY
ncbi:MAG: hypothetical protein HC860_24630 [Alkalinema sp. RU_4_3]|nr:hypothetical protein [Alkalinema sp. RU_4_3]